MGIKKFLLIPAFFRRNPANAWMVAILASSIPCIRQISDNFQASTHLSMLFPLDSPPSSYPPMFLPTDVGSVIGVYYEPVDFHQARLHILLNNNDLEPKVNFIYNFLSQDTFLIKLEVLKIMKK